MSSEISLIHNPVMLKEMLHYILPKDGGVYVDATFGAGGYSKAILSAAECYLYAIDQDQSVEEIFNQLSLSFPDRAKFFNCNFAQMADVLPENLKVEGVVLDIGVSSMQLDNGERGFSFLHDGPLDMRMSTSIVLNAETIVNSYTEKNIADIIFQFGEERLSRKIARAIVNARHRKRLISTVELADVVRSCFPKRYYKIDPATKTFQALRIFINKELESLKKAIEVSLSLLKNGGRLIVVSFHSLEDRIVKTMFKEVHGQGFNLINKKIVIPSPQEVHSNPRSRSARMRIIEKL